jgi:hypothetical protein
MPTDDLSLGEFLKAFAARLSEQQIPIPFQNERPWHTLFYKLQKQSGRKPAFLRDLRFDWDGVYPKCRELSEFLQALHWNASVSAINPQYERIILPAEVATLWRTRYTLDKTATAVLDSAVLTARNEFRDPASEPVATG